MSAKLIDYSFSRPTVPADVVAVVRYVVGGSESKQLDAAEIAQLHRDGKAIVFAFESTATRSAGSEADGATDCDAVEAYARTIGYPLKCPIFYAVDFDARPDQVMAYFRGIFSRDVHPSGPYAGISVINAVLKAHPHAVGWQTLAWSSGKRAKSKRCVLYQNGVSMSGYDSDVTCQPFYAWGKDGAVLIGGKHKPAPTPLTKTGLSFRTRRAAHHLVYALPRRKHAPTDFGAKILDEVAVAIHIALTK